MTRIVRAGCLVLVSVICGCGGGVPSTPNSGPPPPHGGNLVALPGGKGYVEVVKKDASGKAAVTAELSFYFMKDASTPISPAPSSGTLTVGDKKFQLKAEGDGLVTPTGPPIFPKGGVDGTLSALVDGKTLNVPLGVR
jgi:hypothetical protein